MLNILFLLDKKVKNIELDWKKSHKINQTLK